jgi:hypothetical protein
MDQIIGIVRGDSPATEQEVTAEIVKALEQTGKIKFGKKDAS